MQLIKPINTYKYLPIFCLALLLISGCNEAGKKSSVQRIAPETSKQASNPAIQRIAFGSCLFPQYVDTISPNLGQAIIDQKPELFIFMGDIIYHDLFLTEGDPISGKYKYFLDKYIAHDDSMNLKQWREKLSPFLSIEKYKKDFNDLKKTNFYQSLHQYFSQLAKEKTLVQNAGGAPGIIGVWDDHDFGYNDSGRLHPKYFPYKKIYQEFIGKNHLNPNQKGVYASYYFGAQPKTLQVILLDLRSFKTEHRELKQGAEGVLLGEKQWKWLTNELKKKAQVRIIVSSFPVVADAQQSKKERWEIFKSEKMKLLKLLDTVNSSSLVIVSGDWHVPYISVDQKSLNYPLYDFTVGSLGHGKSIIKDRFKTPNDYIVPELEENQLKFLTKKPPNNFGLIEIDWENKKLKFTTIDAMGKSLGEDFSYTIAFMEEKI